jgi:hypothetical protein
MQHADQSRFSGPSTAFSNDVQVLSMPPASSHLAALRFTIEL